MRGEPSKADQLPTQDPDDRPAAPASYNAALGLDNGLWFSLRNPINFPSFLRLNQKEIHEYLRPSSQDQDDFTDAFPHSLSIQAVFQTELGGI